MYLVYLVAVSYHETSQFSALPASLTVQRADVALEFVFSRGSSPPLAPFLSTMAGFIAGNPSTTVVTDCDAVLTAASLVYIPASSPLGQSWAFLYPDAVGLHPANAPMHPADRVSLPQWAVIKFFLPRCSLSAAMAPPPLGLSFFTANFTSAFWSRILSHLVDQGMLDSVSDSPRALAKTILALSVDKAVMTVNTSDLAPVEPFDTPPFYGPLVAAMPAAPPHVVTPSAPGPQELRFLAIAPAAAFADTRNTTAPLAGFAFLCGHLGATCTSASRTDPSGILHSAAAVLRRGLLSKFGNHVGDGPLSRQLPSFANALVSNFTTFLETDSTLPAELEVQLSDAVQLFVGSPDERASIERQRAIFATSQVSIYVAAE